MKNFIKKSLILVLFILFSGYISFIFQKIPDFDFFAYHYYNGWAFLNDRIGIDIMPTFARTYFNPILDSINYLVITNFSTHPILFYFITGLKYGLFLFLSYLYINLFREQKNINKVFVIISYLALIFFSPILLHNIGCDLNDIQINNIILISFYIFIKNVLEEYSFKQQILLFISSLLIGMATGLKYTAFIYIISFLLCYLFNYKRLKKPIKTFFLFFVGILLGFIITDGWWIYKIYKHFNNPVFPYLNNIFNSSFGVNNSVLIDDFGHIRPKNIVDFIFAPILNSLKGNIGFETGFFDLKIPLTFCFILYYLILKIKKLNIKIIENIINPNILDTCLVFIVASYYINLLFFGQLRYVLALIPIVCLLFIVITYLYSYYAKEQAIEKNIIIFIIIFCIAKHSLCFADFGFLEDYAFLLLIYAVGVFIYIYFSKNLLLTQKHYCAMILIIIILVISTTKIPGCAIRANHSNCDPLIKVEDQKLKDNSVVLCGSLISCFIAPTQNNKVKYAAFGMQDKYYNILDKKQSIKARLQYNSPYLINEIKKIFEKNENIYCVFALQDTGKEKTIRPTIKKGKISKQIDVDIYDILKVDEDSENNSITKSYENYENNILSDDDLMQMSVLDIYEKSLQDYSGKKVNFFNDCSVIDYKVANLTNYMNYYVICKIK